MATAAAASTKKWAREYETIYILRPDVEHDAAERVVGRAQDVIARLDGKLTKLDNWGKRKLAYPIQKNTRGIFVYLKYVGFSDLVAELERNLRLLDEVVRFQTVLLTEDVDPDAVNVDPEEVQYLHVEEEEEAEDADLERARSLGMAPRAPREDELSPSEAPSAAGEATDGPVDDEVAASEAPEAPEAEVPEAEAPEAAPAGVPEDTDATAEEPTPEAAAPSDENTEKES